MQQIDLDEKADTMTPVRTRPSRGLTRASAAIALATAAVLAAAGCSSSSSKNTINLVAYSVPKPAYDALSAAFTKTSAGKDVDFKPSYGPSGTQSKNVLGGQKADYVGFSVEPDLTKLVPKKVASGWDSGATKGNVSNSVVVIVVRKGNPKRITGWDDLTKGNVKIVTPSPASSGSAKWNILAAYSHVMQQGGTPAQAKAYLTKFFAHITSRAPSGSAATQQFVGGTGDALISYEDEAIAARAAGKKLDYVVPDQSILIENPAAVTKSASGKAKDFFKFVLSTQGQEIFAGKGFRPVNKSTTIPTVKGANDPGNPFPQVKQLITIAKLGGWDSVNEKFFGDNGISTKIETG